MQEVFVLMRTRRRLFAPRRCEQPSGYEVKAPRGLQDPKAWRAFMW